MCILLIKTGVEKYANRIFTSDIFLVSRKQGQDTIKLTDHPTYMPHEQIVCGPNGIFGQWEVGHVLLDPGLKLLGVFTRKILAHDPHNDSRATHLMLHCAFKVTCKEDRRYTLNYWGHNAGEEISVLLSGGFHLQDEMKNKYKIGTQLSKLPF